MSEAILEAELVAACSCLGYSDGQKYIKDPDCTETIRDLLRYLRRDDSSHQIRLALGQTRVVQTDLIPLLREHAKDKVLLDLVLRLLVNLTSPALLVFHQEIPEDKVGRQMYLKLVSQQQCFKEAFTEAGVWASLASILGAGLQQEGDRDDDTNLVVEMSLVLLRNVLAVAPGRQDNTRTHDDADLHDQVLWSLHLASLPDLLLYLSTCQHEEDLALHTLEIISLMLRQQDPQSLATSTLQRSSEEKSKDDSELVRLRDAEKARRQQQVRKHYNARHSRFGGTYYVQNMKSISDRDIIAHKPVTDVTAIDFDRNKRGKKIPKNRAPLQNASATRRSTLAIRLFLQEFCVEFLNGAYNNVMSIVKDSLNRARTQEHDESYYLWAMSFFMEFNRYNDFKLELVSETLSVQTVHYVQTNIENYYEMMTTEKKKIPLWSRRMHNGLRAYYEILMTLATMDKSTDESIRGSSLALKSKIFYVVEYRELPMILLQNYEEAKMSKAYLKDLIETTHIFLKLLEGMCKKTKHLMVQQSQKKKASKKKKPTKESVAAPTPEKLDEMWSLLADELSSVLQGEAGELPMVVPFDALSDQTEDQQKELAMRKINALLRKRELKESVSLFRASREVWPQGDIFGGQEIDFSEEFSCLREVFMADLNPVEQPAEEPPESEDEQDEEEVQELEESSAHISERELEFPSFIRRFAHTKIMQSYCLLLKSYSMNSAHTNRCIIKLFHRIAWDSKMPAIFFQSTLFATFHSAMTDPAKKSNEIIGEIVKFASYIIRQFFKVAETNPKVFMEILFWKSNKEAVDIECGYDVPAQTNAMKAVWSEEEDDEITRLYEEFKEKEFGPDDEKDLVDIIVQNLIRQDRSRRLVIKKLKELCLIQNVNELRGKKTTRVKSRQWTETEEDELKVLFDEHKDAMDPMARIMDYMIAPKPKHRVLEKLLELGLIQDKKEMKKKRVNKPKQQRPKNSKNNGEKFLAANENSCDDDDDNDVNSDDDSQDSSDDDDTAAVSRRKSATAAPVVTPYLISVALNKVLEGGMRTSIEWLVEILTDVADDREQDGEFEAIPILPITEDQTQAVENQHFKSLIKIIGLQEPETHQEMFWRVPAKLSIQGLRKRSQYLTEGLEGTLLPQPEQQQDHASAENVGDAESAVITEKKQKKKPRVRKPLIVGNSDSDEDKENFNENFTDGKTADSDPESLLRAATTPAPLSAQNTPRSAAKRSLSDDFDSLLSSNNKSVKKRRIVMEDSDDDDENSQLPAINTENLQLRLNTEDFSEEMNNDETRVVDNGSATISRIIDSDDDSNGLGGVSVISGSKSSGNSNEMQRKKRRIVLDSDDEDDNTPTIRSKTIIDSDDDDTPTIRSRGIVHSDADDDSPIIRSKAIIDSDDAL